MASPSAGSTSCSFLSSSTSARSAPNCSRQLSVRGASAIAARAFRSPSPVSGENSSVTLAAARQAPNIAGMASPVSETYRYRLISLASGPICSRRIASGLESSFNVRHTVSNRSELAINFAARSEETDNGPDHVVPREQFVGVVIGFRNDDEPLSG